MDSTELMLNLFPIVVTEIESRLGTTPFPEPAEELRLLLIQLLCQLLCPPCASLAADQFQSIVNVIVKASSDNFHDVKVACAEAVECLSATTPDQVHLSLSALATSQCLNLNHQRSAVRKAALKALTQLLPLGSESLAKLMEESIFPALRKLTTDRTASVRVALASSVAKWMAELPDVKSYEVDLTHLLLQLKGQDLPAVRDAASGALAKSAAARNRMLNGKSGSEEQEMKAEGDREEAESQDRSQSCQLVQRYEKMSPAVTMSTLVTPSPLSWSSGSFPTSCPKSSPQ